VRSAKLIVRIFMSYDMREDCVIYYNIRYREMFYIVFINFYYDHNTGKYYGSNDLVTDVDIRERQL